MMAHPARSTGFFARRRGFTLVELLTALMILSLLALMSYRGLGALLDARQHVSEESAKWRRAAAFFDRFEQDIRLAAPRPVRATSAGSGVAPAWMGRSEGSPGPSLEFSRFAAADADSARRVTYRLGGNQEIELLLWPGLDLAPGAQFARYPVLSGVSRFELQYLNSDYNWVPSWPVPGAEATMPRAVQLRVVLRSGEDMMRVFALQP
jgi:general secretion pathway protein J